MEELVKLILFTTIFLSCDPGLDLGISQANFENQQLAACSTELQ